MTKDELITLCRQSALIQNIDPDLYQAVISIESGFRPNAMRYEPAWMYFQNPPAHASRLGLTVTTETQMQMFSYGLSQCMGSVLRELGFVDYLTEALNPAVNLQYGARHLQSYLLKYGDPAKSVSAYNSGTPIKLYTGKWKNQDYVDKVMGVYQTLKSAGTLI